MGHKATESTPEPAEGVLGLDVFLLTLPACKFSFFSKLLASPHFHTVKGDRDISTLLREVSEVSGLESP